MNNEISIVELTTIVSKILDIPNRILSKRRTEEITRGRFMSAQLYKRLYPHTSSSKMSELFAKDISNVRFWYKKHSDYMETDKGYVIDYTSCCNALGLDVNDNIQIDTAIIISELNDTIYKLTAENYKLKSSVSMIIRCTDEVSNVINNI